MQKKRNAKTPTLSPNGATLKNQSFLKRNVFVILAFFIPFLFMFICFAINKVSPFGTQQILVTDLWHQYYPFLVDFQSKLKEGGSLLWTWKSGGGTNYLALMSYYLASPLNFLSVFVPSQWLREFLFIITCVKIGCAGCFFSIFLKITFKRNDISITFFGILYALCSFIMGYYWNVIWLDTIALLPLVIAGSFALLRYGRFRLYIISLAVSVFASYYIGLFTCFFVFLVAVSYEIVEFKSIKKLFVDFLKMLGSSILALMMTALLTLPAFFALTHTHSADNTFPATFALNMADSADMKGLFQALGKTLANIGAFLQPTCKEGLPNVYAGVVTLVLALLFLCCKKIKIRERVICVLLLLFFMLSFAIRQLDYIWHGLHFPNMLPYRFSFLFCFVLIYMAFRVFMYIEDLKFASIFIAVAGITGVVIVMIQHLDDVKPAGTEQFGKNIPIIATVIIAVLTIAWVALYTLRIVPKQALAAALCAIVLAEGACSAYIGVKTVSVTDSSYYPLGTTNTYACNDYAKELEENTTDLARTEVTKYYTLNDDALVGFNGVSMFSSVANEKITKYLEKFGLCGWVGSNRYSYMESSPFTNMMLNLKYLLSVNGKYLDTRHTSLIYQSGDVKLLRNNNYLPMGFLVHPDVLSFRTETASLNPFENQNKIFREATELDGDLYEFLQVATQGHTDFETFPVTKNSYGNYTYSLKDESVTPHIKYNYEAPEDGTACAYLECTGAENVSLRINDSEVDNKYIKRPFIMMIGNVKKGDKISLYSDINDSTSGTITVYCTMFNNALFEKAYEKLSQNTLKANKVTDTEITGTINAKKAGLLYTSIPYIDGWKAYVDDEEVTITPVGDAMLSFKVKEGVHSIKLKYTPEGFVLGLIASILAILIFIALCLYFFVLRDKDKRLKMKNAGKTIETAAAALINTDASETETAETEDPSDDVPDSEPDPDAPVDPEVNQKEPEKTPAKKSKKKKK